MISTPNSKTISFQTPDGISLDAWVLTPPDGNGDFVLLLHGLADNRLGMTGYARLFIAHGFTVLLPDARAHGSSGGAVATFGWLERNDIHQWVDWIALQNHPHCIFGFGESMGAAQLLQSLSVGTRFCTVVAESSFSDFREVAYDRMGQPFHLDPWFGQTVLRRNRDIPRILETLFCISCAPAVDIPVFLFSTPSSFHN